MPLPTPIGRQRDVLYLPASGHTVVLGTAGSGKTILAILRAAYLAHPATEHSGPTLLLTFNKALVAYLKHLAGPELDGVTVENYHRFARGYLSARDLIGWNQICPPRRRLQLVREAIASLRAAGGNAPVLLCRAEVLAEAVQQIHQLGVQTADAYSEMAPQLPAPLGADEQTLRAVWQVRNRYHELRLAAGYPYDWDDLAGAVLEELTRDDSPRRYRHIVVDEGQDFSPTMIRSLTKAVTADGSFTFFADVAQQIYGHRFSWRSAGLEISQPWRFEENYRNTKQIAELALALTAMPYYKGIADLVSPKSPRASGPLPALVTFESVAKETRFIVNQAVTQSRVGSVAILVPTHAEKARFAAQFKPGTFVELNTELSRWKSASGLSIGTYHSSKGVEFDSVLLPAITATAFPDPETVGISGLEYAEQTAGRLLYVGITRAKSTLIMTYSGTVTALLPKRSELIQQSRQ